MNFKYGGYTAYKYRIVNYELKRMWKADMSAFNYRTEEKLENPQSGYRSSG
jgi:hypothetical protein